MEVNIQSKDHKDYLDFVVEGLKKYNKSNNCIEKIDVYYSSLAVTYKQDIVNYTELLQIHDQFLQYGLESFISNADMKNGRKISYSMVEDTEN